jgi:hypothetical protein
MNSDQLIQQQEQRLLALRGELAQAEQHAQTVKAEAHRTEGRIIQLRENAQPKPVQNESEDNQ